MGSYTLVKICRKENSILNINYTEHVSQSKSFRQRFLVLHYTALNFADSAKTLTVGGVSAHYLVPTLKSIDPTYHKEELVVYSLVPESDRAWHAGVSAWNGRNNLNDTSIGIEIVNMATESKFMPFPDAQVSCIIALCQNILARYPDIVPVNVVGHSDIGIGRKMDPGPLFPWKTLYDNGIGAWYEYDVVDKYKSKFEMNLPTKEDVYNKLIRYGYHASINEFTALLRSFQMHFRNEKYDGILDAETAAIAYALIDKYILE
ncbi:MAG: N-acetylmuramoyl-L-alanine amidase [Desulfovibrionaceae bacterium]